MVLAASTSVVWAFAFPLIKLGIPAFGIAPDDTGSKTLFAGVRFAAAGLLVSFISVVLPTIARRAEANRTIHNTQSRPGAGRKGAARPFGENARRGVLLALLLGLVNTALHYFCYYIGLSNLTGSRSAVIDSLSSFLLIPKSPSLNVPRELIKMFSGFMSRWMICILPQASRAAMRNCHVL